MGFWGSLFGGSNPTLNAGMKQSGQMSQFASSKGENLLTQAGDFWSGLLSGDSAKTAKLLAPQIQGMQQRGQQEKQSMAQFGNRSGGTNAKAQTIDDTTRGNIDNMISSLTGAAASNAGSMGQGLFSSGLEALNQQFNMSQQQMENWSNSLLGKGMTTGVAAAEKFALMGGG